MAWKPTGVAMPARPLLAVLSAVLLFGCAEKQSSPVMPPKPEDSAVQAALVEDGLTVAEGNCARCHAIGRQGDSPLPAAPVFRSVLRRYNGDVLETALIWGMRVAHGPMPQFQFKPEAATALLAYLRSIQVHDPGLALVEQRCARCHSIGPTGVSPYPGAQPFRNLGQRWTRRQLRDALQVGILAEHDTAEARVPPMKLKDAEIDLLLDYLDSMATEEYPAPPRP
jgi:mono/diheme cytochrome c family protein